MDPVTNTFGLPKTVHYCVKCNLSNQQPTSTNEYLHHKNTRHVAVKFTSDGVCSACLHAEKKWSGQIDWKERELQFKDLCNQYRKTDGTYDCLIGGSGGKDSVFQSWILKYKYGMHPLTVTWAPGLYTDIGWRNFQSWIHKGGFDNFLYTPSGSTHRLITRNATLNLLHPFQPFILGQKTFAMKMALKFGIQFLLYGESPADYGMNISSDEKGFNPSAIKQKGYELSPTENVKFRDIYLGGKTVGEYLADGVPQIDLMGYIPADSELIRQGDLKQYYAGYFFKWVPQEMFYFASEKIDFEVNPERTEGTYQKYQSIDDKLDGFFYYTRYIKFGVGRTMMDSAQEVRNKHIDKTEGLRLIKKFDGEYPSKYEKEFLAYTDLTAEQFKQLCDENRKAHLWKFDSTKKEWALRLTPWEYFK